MNDNAPQVGDKPNKRSIDGHRVRFTLREPNLRLGTLADLENNKFESETVGDGDEGTYLGIHPTLDNWHILSVNIDGRELFVPAADGQFEWVQP